MCLCLFVFEGKTWCLSPHLCLSGVSRLGHPTVSGCFPPPPTSLLLSPPLFSCGGAPPHRGSFDRKDRRSPAEKDGVQVNNRVFSGLDDPAAFRLTFVPSSFYPGSLCLPGGWSQEVWASASWCCGLDLLGWWTPVPRRL